MGLKIKNYLIPAISYLRHLSFPLIFHQLLPDSDIMWTFVGDIANLYCGDIIATDIFFKQVVTK